jgi:hypothetical protein
MACLFGHKWNGCKCEKCEKTRDEQHDWDGCKCKRCGKTRDESHKQKNGICSVCGEELKSFEIFSFEEISVIAELMTIISTAPLNISNDFIKKCSEKLAKIFMKIALEKENETKYKLLLKSSWLSKQDCAFINQFVISEINSPSNNLDVEKRTVYKRLQIKFFNIETGKNIIMI